ncbi:MAG: hypothetical protein WKF70_08885 [Chitinophagaceae bacterium]
MIHCIVVIHRQFLVILPVGIIEVDAITPHGKRSGAAGNNTGISSQGLYSRLVLELPNLVHL